MCLYGYFGLVLTPSTLLRLLQQFLLFFLETTSINCCAFDGG
jgi:hypothetical protein